MPASQICAPLSTPQSAHDQLHAFLQQRQRAQEPVADLDAFEQQLHRLFVAAEREAFAQDLARFDVDVPVIEVDGERYRRVLRCEQTYSSAAGPVRVERALYRQHPADERALCPLELRAGIIAGYWTPLAAKPATWVVAHLTPQEGEELLALRGNMTPSKSSLDRRPKQLSTHWEPARAQFEAALRQQEAVPAAAVTFAVSLDGVLVPMKDGARPAKRAQAMAQGKSPSGPAGYQEVGCATVSYYAQDGTRLGTRRMARMPETNKHTLKAQLTAEVMGVLGQRPDLRVVQLADGAPDHWSYLSNRFPLGEEVLDFYHAVEQLNGALGAAYGEGSPRYLKRAETLRQVLRDAPQGVDKVIGALQRLRIRSPRRQAIHKTLAYVRDHRHRMRYADLRAQNLPIGSGVVAAACKTVVSQRLKRSGMRWRATGGQAILTFRALCQSERFERAWPLLVKTYQRNVRLPPKVIALSERR
jgi:hypothetical protein